VPFADFGTDYGGIGWLTLVLPLFLLALVIVWWRISWGRGSAAPPDVTQQGGGQAGARKKPSAGDASPALVPLLPAARLLPLALVLVVALAVAVLWWWHATRRTDG